MTRRGLTPMDGALRARLDEREWAWASAGVAGLPGWASVLPVDRDGSEVEPVGPSGFEEPDPDATPVRGVPVVHATAASEPSRRTSTPCSAPRSRPEAPPSSPSR